MRTSVGPRGHRREHRLVSLAVRQDGVVSFWQLAELGLDAGRIQRRLADGRLHRVHEGVYAVGLPRLTRRGTWHAAVLACHRGAVLSHHDAAELWGFGNRRDRVHVTIPTRSGLAQPDVVVHRPRRLPADEVTVRDGIPVTTVARTLLDLAPLVPPRTLDRMVRRAEDLRVFDRAAVDAVLTAHPRRRGRRRLQIAIAQWDPALTRSELEERFLRLCSRGDLGRPAVNALVAGFECDFVWRAQRLVVETDGFAFHKDREAFERDRRRDEALTLAGYRVVRFTWRRVVDDPAGVADTLKRLLEADVGRLNTAYRR